MIDQKTPREIAIELLKDPRVNGAFIKAMKSGDYEVVMSIDDLCFGDVLDKALEYLNQVFSANKIHFEQHEVYSGFGRDLVITDLKKKKLHDAQLTSHTIDEAYEVSGFNKGLVCISENTRPERRLTQAEFDELVEDLKDFEIIRKERLKRLVNKCE